MTIYKEFELIGLYGQIAWLRGNSEIPPDASIIIPVNAQGDLQKVLGPISEISRYSGKHSFEIILVINNYPPEDPPEEITQFTEAGIRVVSVPHARRPGEVVIISARALGVEAASSNITIHFDADCKFSNITSLLDWYLTVLNSYAKAAYSHVAFYDYKKIISVRVKIFTHHTARWIKRNFLGIPTTRGSNYAIHRDLFLELYRAGKLSVDLQVGPAVKLTGNRIIYSGRPELTVFTSGRKMRGGWSQLYRMLKYRLRFNLKVISLFNKKGDHKNWDGFDKESVRREKAILSQEENSQHSRLT